MSYLTHTQTNRPVAIMGALGIPTAFGALLIVGLAVTGTIGPEISTGPLPTREYKDPPPPQPEPDQTQQPTKSVVTAPPVPIPLPIPQPNDRVIEEPDFTNTATSPIVGKLPPIDAGPITPPTPPSIFLDPVAATPSNRPSRWVTDSDYRSSWIRREYSGQASFSLEVSTGGRVTNCAITRSTGHQALDTATCKLITKRARFNPAMDSSGAPTAGTFSSSINWQLPN